MDTIKQNVFSIKEMMEKTTSMFRYIFSKWYLICLVAFLSGCIGVAFAWFSQAEYTAEMTFITEAESSSKVGGYAGIAAQFGIDVGEGGSNIFSGDNLNEIMKSHSLLEKTLLNPLKVGDSSFLLIDCYLEKHKIKREIDWLYFLIIVLW